MDDNRHGTGQPGQATKAGFMNEPQRPKTRQAETIAISDPDAAAMSDSAPLPTGNGGIPDRGLAVFAGTLVLATVFVAARMGSRCASTWLDMGYRDLMPPSAESDRLR
ncbi:hypothetical protein NW767_006955 [Fusarium falciforme]|uniref:Uncharacterized protein n=1 Tax=Fusarium falciforme TaxID=195108 RepID=A0A9W8QZU4_9HYPO|nr:hypothetical protein NW755_009654 [Fusarium falciforme]KAJ4201305.1 hypothetical protein NW767_006955 [Fusarium falciforme]KAJ4246905.1 hypothetical protein NW757_009056 [Fusarium falciforme]